MSPFVKAAAYALVDQPVVNAVIDGQDVVYRDYVDISVAVATPKVKIQSQVCSCKQFLPREKLRSISENGRQTEVRAKVVP